MWCDMCQEYGRHKDGCPNEPPVTICQNCGNVLYKGDEWYPELPACYDCISGEIERMREVL